MSTDNFGDYLSIAYVDNDQTSDCSKSTLSFQSNRILPFSNSPVYNTTILNIKELTKGADVKTVYDVTLDLKDIEHKFEPGDTIGILPCNNEAEVEEILLRLNLSSVADKIYNLSILKNTSKKKPMIPTHIPDRGTLRDLFIKNLDIRSPPKKLFLKSLTRYTVQPEEIEKLLRLSSPKGSQEYNEFITQHRRFLSLLKSFPSCLPPVERLLENLPPLQPRPYSISSSPLLHMSRKELRITFSLINVDENIKGVCTGWLENTIKNINGCKLQKLDPIEVKLQNLNLVDKPNVPFYFRKFNNFRLPENSAVPIIMIGPGTGIAPFIGFLQHRQTENNTKFGTSWLFYGCRYSERDFLYKSDIEEFQRSGTLTKLFVCYSREGPTKTYVQDLIKNNGKDFVDKIIRENAVVYICGDAKNMVKDVRNAIITCLVDFEGWSVTDSEAYLKHLQVTNRYIQDVWV